MTHQYAWVTGEISKGNTILAYSTRAVGKPVAHLTRTDRIALVDGVMYVDGSPSMGWTFARKPQPTPKA